MIRAWILKFERTWGRWPSRRELREQFPEQRQAKLDLVLAKVARDTAGNRS